MIPRLTCKKVRYIDGLRAWGGCLVPSEVVLLVEHGVIPTEGSRDTVERCRAKQKVGDCRPLWFYFTVPKKSKAYMELY